MKNIFVKLALMPLAGALIQTGKQNIICAKYMAGASPAPTG